jgi:hypothetical protein
MTNSISAITVVLEKNMREDDAAPLMSAISQLRGVLSVSGNVSDIMEHVAQLRARRELLDKLIGTLCG